MDIDAGGGILRRNGQCFERRRTETGNRVRATGLDAAAHSEGHRRPTETAADYLREAGVPVRPPGKWGRQPPVSPANEVTTGPDDATASAANGVTAEPLPAKAPNQVNTGSASACADYHELIQTELGKGRNAMAIWQDLIDHHGFSGAYQSVKRYVRKLRGAQGPEACAIVVTAPGEEGQVDYG